MAYLATIRLIVTATTRGKDTDAEPYYRVTQRSTTDGALVAEIARHSGEATGDWNLLLAECERAREGGTA